MLNLHVLAFFVGYYEIFVENVCRLSNFGVIPYFIWE